TLMPSPCLSTPVLAAPALSRGGSAAQKSRHLPKISDGSLLAALAIDEGTKHRPLQISLQAKRSGNGFSLNGAKAFVVDGHTADLLIVAGRSAGSPGARDGLTLVLGDPKAQGTATERAAQLYIEIEITRAAVLKALQTLDANFDQAGAAVSVAKARAGTTATLAVQEGVQMHGGMGMTDQFDIGFFMKRARVCQELFGD